jgi:RNA polymerase-binding transcription factor DksA
MGASKGSALTRESRDAARAGVPRRGRPAIRQHRQAPQEAAPAVRILSERREILGHIAVLEGRQSPGEPGRVLGNPRRSPDPLDCAYAITVEHEGLATRQILASRLASLRRAAEKVGEGTYGRCDDCARPITVARLRAIPEATRCVFCAEQAEAREPRPPK